MGRTRSGYIVPSLLVPLARVAHCYCLWSKTNINCYRSVIHEMKYSTHAMLPYQKNSALGMCHHLANVNHSSCDLNGRGQRWLHSAFPPRPSHSSCTLSLTPCLWSRTNVYSCCSIIRENEILRAQEASLSELLLCWYVPPPCVSQC